MMDIEVLSQIKEIAASDDELWADAPLTAASPSDRQITALINKLSNMYQFIIGRANPLACRELLPIVDRCLDRLAWFPSKDQLSKISSLFKLIRTAAQSAEPHKFPA
jgi:hypothetical protein